MSVVDKVSSPDRVCSLQCSEVSPHIGVRVEDDGNCSVLTVCFVLFQGT